MVPAFALPVSPAIFAMKLVLLAASVKTALSNVVVKMEQLVHLKPVSVNVLPVGKANSAIVLVATIPLVFIATKNVFVRMAGLVIL